MWKRQPAAPAEEERHHTPAMLRSHILLWGMGCGQELMWRVWKGNSKASSWLFYCCFIWQHSLILRWEPPRLFLLIPPSRPKH